MTNLEKTSAKIRELVPRLMELSLGCELEIVDDVYKVPVKWTEIIKFTEDSIEEKEGECLNLVFDSEDELLVSLDIITTVYGTLILRNEKDWQVKIIGHPIQLCDVLEAIKHHIGLDRPIKLSDLWIDILDIWEYSKPYAEQTPEVHDFVASILL